MENKNKSIAYLGVPGAFSEQACLEFNPTLVRQGCKSLDEAFSLAKAKKCDFVCLPIENSLAGSINATYDLIIDSDMEIIMEQIIRIEHYLLAKENASLPDIKKVYSHYQAISQCSKFLSNLNVETIEVFNTAGAARKISEEGTEQEAAIASKYAAELYNLNILASNIEDANFNYTRFVILAYNAPKFNENLEYKTSLMLETRHQAGELAKCLDIFRQHNVNMTKLESRPKRDEPWRHRFYIDIEGYYHDSNIEVALLELLRAAATLKYLGCYPMTNNEHTI